MKTTEQALRELIASWRAKIADIRLKTDMYDDGPKTHRTDMLEECAEQAEAILKEGLTSVAEPSASAP